MAHLHLVQDDDLYFSIDPYSRTITYEGEEALVITKGDHNSERFTFEVPRIVEGHDLMLCDKVEVHYINIPSGNTNAKSADVYMVKDLQLAADDENIVMFTWLLSQNATMYVGSLNFAIRFVCTSGSKVDYTWRTGVYSSIAVIDTVNNSDLVVEQYSDTLQEWYMELLMAGTQGVNMVEIAEKEAIERIAQVDYVVKVEQDAIDRIVAARDEAIQNVEETESRTIEEEKEELIEELIRRVPVYNGAVENLTDNIPVYTGETEDAI